LLYQLRMIKHFRSLDSISKTFNLIFDIRDKKQEKQLQRPIRPVFLTLLI